MSNFIAHASEQVLRFTSVDSWGDLNEERKIQLSFNMGVMALGLGLTKEESYKPLTDTRNGDLSIQKLHTHLRKLIISNKVSVKEENIAKPF